MTGVRTPASKRGRKAERSTIFARLNDQVLLEADADGNIAARIEDYLIPVGKLSAAAARRAAKLRAGLPLNSFSSDGNAVEAELDALVRRLARRGLLEYRLAKAGDDDDLVVIEPQVPDYWPRMAPPRDTETIVLSRFAYLRRRGNDMVLESPRAGALFRICDPAIAALLASLTTPQKVGRLRRHGGFPGIALIALLIDCQILFTIDAGRDGLRHSEGDDSLVFWDFHDLLFHTRSTEGRQANPLGGLYPHAGVISPLPAVRPSWPGTRIDLKKLAPAETASPIVQLLHQRHSVRDFDDRQPITLTELAQLLDRAARIRSKWGGKLEFSDDGPDIEYTSRPYPAAGSAYELELYLAVVNCEGLARGFYHYDADEHALVPLAVRTQELEAMLQSAEFAMDAPAPPQILMTIAARFGRISWKYSSIAYTLILKDVGVLIQTLYIVATSMGLGGCAIGTTNIDLFAKMTGIDFHVEGPVGQFALGRGVKSETSG
jgi:SagB-type dehydrogenase family enzyme